MFSHVLSVREAYDYKIKNEDANFLGCLNLCFFPRIGILYGGSLAIKIRTLSVRRPLASSHDKENINIEHN